MPHNSCDRVIDVWVARSLQRRYQAVLCEALPGELLALLERTSAPPQHVRDTES